MRPISEIACLSKVEEVVVGLPLYRFVLKSHETLIFENPSLEGIVYLKEVCKAFDFLVETQVAEECAESVAPLHTENSKPGCMR